jgi:predicted nucleic acid-binding protein
VILVDTNVWSEAAKPNGTRKVVRWTEQNRNDLWLSTIVIAEIRAGIENPESGVKRAGLEQWLQRLEFLNAARTLPFDSLAAYALGQLLAAKPQQKNMLDTMLAAQALSRDCVIATCNTRDFEWTGVKLVNPWEV